MRVVCAECGEDIINEREVRAEGKIVCRACAGDCYYTDIADERTLVEFAHSAFAMPGD